MTETLKKISILGGIFTLVVSIYWSQDGFNFNIAGDGGGKSLAIFVGYGLAIVVSIVQFVFSTNLDKLNTSLIVFGVLAYVYSIYTNYLGITHFQGEMVNKFGAWVFAIFVDGVPELLIAWGLGESLTGDFLGNFWKALSGSPKTMPKPKTKYSYTNPPSVHTPLDMDNRISKLPRAKRR